MTEVGVWLVVVGLCDLARAARDVTTVARRLLMVGVGACLFGFAGLALGLEDGDLVVLLVAWMSFFLLWLLGSAAAVVPAGTRTAGRAAVRARTLAFLGLGGGLLVSLLLGGRVDLRDRVVAGSARGVGLDRVLLLAGVAVAQLATANVAVRLVLDAVGVPASTNEKQLKGGRMLGPMERLFIVGLGLAGHAHRCRRRGGGQGPAPLPRAPARHQDRDPSDITEYFLIGSFASWLLALGGLGLLALH